MLSPEKLFGNFFNTEDITTTRLAGFCQDCLNRLTAANDKGRFTPLINVITPALQDLQDELGDVDTSLTMQKGKTLTNNQVMAAFKQTMREQEGVIANAVGGFNSAAYLEFYPHGLNEYGSANKTQMPLLTHRINIAAAKYAQQLGDALATALEGFEKAWTGSRTQQEQQKGSVDDSRNTRTGARQTVEQVLLVTIHTVATMFPGDAATCSSFFDFSLLYAQAHPHKTEKLTGNIAKTETAVAVNRSFTDKVEIKLTSVSDNASLLAFLGATADAQPNGKGVEVKPTKSRNLKLSELGDESGTFLLIKNMSEVNDAAYLLELKG